MQRLRSLAIGLAATALLIGAMGAPATAATGATVAVVHGIPGVKVDVCVNGAVLVKDFKYAQKVVLDNALPAGKYKFVVKLAKNAKTCQGATVIKQKVTLTGAENLTVVAAYVKGEPGFRIFDHLDALAASPVSTSVDISGIIMAHASRAGKVDAFASLIIPEAFPASKATFPGLKRGKSDGLVIGGPTYDWVTWFSEPGKTKPFIGPKYKNTRSGQLNHYVLVGDAASNYTIVFFRTVFDLD